MAIVRTRFEDHLGDTHHFHSDSRVVWRPDGTSVEAALAALEVLYICTGTNDDLAIEALLNDFFNNSTANRMRLTIVGTMGLRSISLLTAYSGNLKGFIVINSLNTRGAVVEIDWSACNDIIVPTNVIPSYGVYFLAISGGGNINFIGGIRLTNLQSNNLGCGFHVLYNQPAKLNIGNNNIIKCSGIAFYNSGIKDGGNLWIGDSNYIIVQGATMVIDVSGGPVFIGNNNVFSKTVAGTGSSNNKSILNIASSGEVVIGNGNVFQSAGLTIYMTTTTKLVVGDGNKFIAALDYALHLGTTFGGSVYIGASTLISNFTTGNAIYVEASYTTANIMLMGTQLKGGATATYDINQTTAVNTVRWHIEGCLFSKANTYVNGAAAAFQASSGSIYFPQYANKFSVTYIE